jgi:rubrerythrin
MHRLRSALTLRWAPTLIEPLPEKGDTSMTFEAAILTAIEYERKIRDVYREAAAALDDEAGKRIFEALGNDEQHHIDYLRHTLEQLKNTGKIDPAALESSIPSQDAINREAVKFESMVAKDFHGIRKQMLSRALQVEIETSEFYRKMVNELADEGRALFARFLEIEKNHIKAVEFELDYISKTGYWFDFKEFDME